jgi:hypothetical protein
VRFGRVGAASRRAVAICSAALIGSAPHCSAMTWPWTDDSPCPLSTGREHVPKAEISVARAEAVLEHRKAAPHAADEHVVAARGDDLKNGGKPPPYVAVGSGSERVPLGAKALTIIAPAERSATTVLMQSPISDLAMNLRRQRKYGPSRIRSSADLAFAGLDPRATLRRRHGGSAQSVTAAASDPVGPRAGEGG